MRTTFTSSIIFSIVLHLVFAFVVSSAFVSCTATVSENQSPKQEDTIDATLLTEKQADTYYAQQRDQKKKLQRLQAQKKAAERKRRELERKRKAQQIELQKRQAVEKKRKAEVVRLEKERIAKQKAKEKAEELTKQKQREEEAQQRALAEAERKKIEEQHIAQELQRKEELARLEAENKEQLRMRKINLSKWTNQYIRNIKSSVESRWKRPPASIKGGECIVRVSQKPNGQIDAVNIVSCDGDKLYRRSVIEAIWKANPLPPPPVADVFDSEVEFTFRKEYGE